MPKRKTEGKSIELRKLTIYERMSEETTAFVAELYIDGINVGQAKNDGHGGSTDYNAYPEHRKLLVEAENQCLALPPIKCEGFGGRDGFEIPMNLEHYIDELVQKELQRKSDKKFEKKMANHIMWGIPNGTSYAQVKLPCTLAQAPQGQLQQLVDKYKKQMKEGEVFLNTNLQALGIVI